MIKRYLQILTIIFVITGCTSVPETVAPAGLQNFVGVWQLEESYLSEGIEYNYLVIKSDNTIESWTSRGLEQIFSMSSDGGALAYKTFTPAVPEWEGEKFTLEASLREKKLYLIFTSENQERQWVQVFNPIAMFPDFSYINDFENGNLQNINSHTSVEGDEWQIIVDSDNSPNSVFAPVVANGSSNADIQLSPGKNFTITFDTKRKSEKLSGEESVSALDFNIYRPLAAADDSSELDVNYAENVEFDFDPELELDTWYKIKITVRDGRYFQFFRDETLFGEGEIDEAYITGFKIEGNPDNGIWYMDNLTITWNANSKDPYYTDFTGTTGDFYFNTGGETCDIAEIKDGLLHLRARDYDGFEAGAQAQFFKEIPRNSTIYFAVRFGEYFNSQHPAGHFNFLQKNPDNRINFMAGTDWFGYFAAVGGNYIDGEGVDFRFNKNQFYSFKYHFKEDSIDIYIDDTLLSSVDYIDGLPETGYFVFECHNEYWVNDFGFEIK